MVILGMELRVIIDDYLILDLTSNDVEELRAQAEASIKERLMAHPFGETPDTIKLCMNIPHGTKIIVAQIKVT